LTWWTRRSNPVGLFISDQINYQLADDGEVAVGIFNDLGSGSNVDICVISKTKGVNMLRNYRKPNERLFRAKLPQYEFKRGTTGEIESGGDDDIGWLTLYVVQST